jgi:putative transposase
MVRAPVARQPRLGLSGVPLHVIQRGNNRNDCFHADGDRHLYLKLLRAAADRHKCAVHAYVLMSNHVHLLVTPQTGDAVASMMQDLGRRYVRIFNDLYARSGTLWEGRYKASMIDSERYFLTCQRYIELNPVRAGLAGSAADYRWSSHRHYVYGFSNPMLTPHSIMQSLATEDSARREAYLALFKEPLDPAVVDLIRSSTNKGWPIGSEDFVRRVEVALGRGARPPKRGRPRKQSEGPQADQQEMLI